MYGSSPRAQTEKETEETEKTEETEETEESDEAQEHEEQHLMVRAMLGRDHMMKHMPHALGRLVNSSS